MRATVSSNDRKHRSRNPVLRGLIRRFHKAVVTNVRRIEPKCVIEVGCGEGYVLDAIRQAGLNVRLEGLDICPVAIEQARQRLGEGARLSCCGIRDRVASGGRSDLVLAIEVLEHLDEPEEMLQEIACLTERYVILSVPLEPWFQAANFLQGKYLRRWGNHPEHVQRWTRRGFHQLVSRSFHIIDATVIFPWNMVMAELPR